MSPEYVLYLVLVAFSGFSLGTLGMAVWLHFHMSPLWGINFWRGLVKLGCMIVVGTLLWLVLPRRIVEPSPALWFYLSGLFLVGAGALGVCFRSIRIYIALDEEAYQRKHELPPNR